MEQMGNNKDLRILMLEDTPSDAELAERELRKAGIAFTSKRVDTRVAFIRALEEFHPDVILSDYKLPDFDGMAALQLVQRDHPEIPMIMVTGALSDIEAVDLIHAGAKDYVLKDRLARLAPAVQRALATEQSTRARLAAEKALRESEEKFRALVESSTDWIWELNAQAAYVYASPQVHDLLGYSASEIIGKTPFDLMPPEEAARVRKIFLSIETEKKPFRLLENVNLHKDGRTVFLESSGVPIFDVQGIFRGYRGIDRDITERKRAEKALYESNQILERIFDSTHFSVAYLDRDFNFIRVNRAYAQSSGFPTDYFPGKNHFQLFPNAENEAIFRKVVQSGEPFTISAKPFKFPEHPEWGVSYWDWTLHPLKAFDGSVDALLFVLLDVTARKQAEQALRTSAEKLEQILVQTIQAIATTIEARDPYTAGHQRRVADLAGAIAREMGLSADKIQGLYLAATIHDLGKIHIPAEILSKPGKLSPIEFELIKSHCQAGYDIIKDVQFPWPIAQMMLQHHERINGSGYPQGLNGETILLEARILAVADVIEAISSHRPYRASLGTKAALDEIRKYRGELYDPDVVDASLKLFDEKGYQLPTA